jgi:hypothetical protein
MKTSELIDKAKTAVNGNNTKTVEKDVTKSIVEQASKLPNDMFLWSAVGLLSASVVIGVLGAKSISVTLNQLATPVLIVSLYNKLARVLEEKAERQMAT